MVGICIYIQGSNIHRLKEDVSTPTGGSHIVGSGTPRDGEGLLTPQIFESSGRHECVSA